MNNIFKKKVSTAPTTPTANAAPETKEFAKALEMIHKEKDLKGSSFSYVDLVSRDYNDRLQAVEAEAKKLNKAVYAAQDLFAESHDEEVSKMLKPIKERLKVKSKEFDSAFLASKGDPVLLSYARELDFYDRDLRAIELLQELYSLTRDMVLIDGKIRGLYKNDLDIPRQIGPLDMHISNLCEDFSTLRMPHPNKDKQTLELELVKRMSELAKEQKTKEDNSERIKNIANL